MFASAYYLRHAGRCWQAEKIHRHILLSSSISGPWFSVASVLGPLASARTLSGCIGGDIAAGAPFSL
jgi:hypothetical protein